MAACVRVLLRLLCEGLSPSPELLVQSPCKTQRRNEKMEDFNMDVASLELSVGSNYRHELGTKSHNNEAVSSSGLNSSELSL